VQENDGSGWRRVADIGFLLVRGKGWDGVPGTTHLGTHGEASHPWKLRASDGHDRPVRRTVINLYALVVGEEQAVADIGFVDGARWIAHVSKQPGVGQIPGITQRNVWRQLASVVARVHNPADGELSVVAETLRGVRPLLGAAERRQQQSRKNCNNR